MLMALVVHSDHSREKNLLVAIRFFLNVVPISLIFFGATLTKFVTDWCHL